MRVLGANAIFHDPSAAWELPELAMAWCLTEAGLSGKDVNAVGYSFDPSLCRPAAELGIDDPWDHLRQEYARRAPGFLAEAQRRRGPAMWQGGWRTVERRHS